jgi:uncharacterized delta-60 repeat protein
MNKNVLVFLFTTILCSLMPMLLSAQVNTAWVRRYDSQYHSTDMATCIAVDASGNVYVGGYSNTTTSWDYIVIKYNSNGEQQWLARYDSPQHIIDCINAIVVDNSGNVYVTGYSGYDYVNGIYPDYCTIKYSPNGDTLWVRTFSMPGNVWNNPQGLAVDNSGNVYVSGFGGWASGGSTNHDFVTLKYNEAGVQEWVATYNGPANSSDCAFGMAIDSMANVYVTGYSYNASGNCDYLTIKYSTHGDSLWTRRYTAPATTFNRPNTITCDNEGNCYVSGYSSGSSISYCTTIKYKSDGDTSWIRNFNFSSNQQAKSIKLDNSGNVYIAGTAGPIIMPPTSFMLIKYGPEGTMQWYRLFQGTADSIDFLYNCNQPLAIDNAGNAYITGVCTNLGTHFDYATLKYYPNGDTAWVARYNGPANSLDEPYALTVDASNNVYVTGGSTGSGTSFDFATIKYTPPEGVENTRLPLTITPVPIKIYPNPAKSYFTIRLPQSAAHSVLKLFDASGKLIKSDEMSASGGLGGKEFRMSLKGIAPGVYFLSVGDNLSKLTVLK